MVIHKVIKNMEIYNLAAALLQNFQDTNFSLPVRVNFHLQKNMDTIVGIAQELDAERTKILAKYGTVNEETQQYEFQPDQVEVVNKELQDLFELEQEVKIYLIPLSNFDGINLEGNQVSAISFMIQDEEE